jgi:hypothetical protein
MNSTCKKVLTGMLCTLNFKYDFCNYVYTNSTSSAFHVLVLVACYGFMPMFEGSSQRSLSFCFVTENMEWDF